MNHGSRNTTALTLALVLCAATALADVVNGDFEAGGTGWSINTPQEWSGQFPPAGGNPDGHCNLRSPMADSAGIGCVTQTFLCGDPGQGGDCTITFDYLLQFIEGGPTSGRILVTLDGVTQLVADTPTGGWQTFTLSVPCGEHTIGLCLEVDAGDNGWLASFDNVQAQCDGAVAGEEHTWSTLKQIFH